MSYAIRHTRNAKRQTTFAALLALVTALALTPMLDRAQSQSSGASTMSRQLQDELASQDITFRNPYGGVDTIELANRAKRLKAMNAQRQKTMVEDTDKLLKLTADLNMEVNHEHPKQLNADQLRRLAEIEKLAKNVREKMSDAIGPIQAVPMPVERDERFPGH
jgi:HAMP domain-containing protein